MGWFSLLVLSFQPLLLASQSLPLLLVVSFDGFRWDYPKLHGPLSNFSRLEQRGVRAHSMTPTFTTATAPNHYTLITGLYEYVHGLVSDQIYDPRTKEVFQSSADSPSRWWPVAPIWTVNEQRAGARSGVLGWPHGSVGGVSKAEPYSKGRSFTDMVDQMLRWFTDAAEPINFGAIYFPEPSITGRQYGPHSNEMKSTIRRCDEYLGYLLNEIDKNDKLKNNLHLIVTSDHGMEQVNSTVKPMCLEDFVDVNKIKAFGTETVLNIFVNSPDDINSTFRSLNQIPHSSTHKKNDIPDRYNYRSHPHIGDLIVIVNPGYELYRCSSDASSKDSWRTTHGNYGYDNQIDSMKTIFYGRGPELKENFTLSTTASLYNVDVFGLMCSLLNIDACPPSNGSAAHTLPLLIDSSRAASMSGKEPERLHDGPIGLVIYLLVLVSFVLILIMAVTWSTVAFRNASAMARAAHGDPTTIAEQNQYKFTQINDRKLHPTIGDDNL